MGPSKRLQPAAVACCIYVLTMPGPAMVPAALTSWLNFERSRLLAGDQLVGQAAAAIRERNLQLELAGQPYKT